MDWKAESCREAEREPRPALPTAAKAADANALVRLCAKEAPGSAVRERRGGSACDSIAMRRHQLRSFPDEAPPD